MIWYCCPVEEIKYKYEIYCTLKLLNYETQEGSSSVRNSMSACSSQADNDSTERRTSSPANRSKMHGGRPTDDSHRPAAHSVACFTCMDFC